MTESMHIREDLADIFGSMYPLMALTREEIESALPTLEERKAWREDGDPREMAYRLAKRGKEKILAAFGGEEAVIELGRQRHEAAERARHAKEGGE